MKKAPIIKGLKRARESEAEQRLGESEERYRALAHSAMDAIISADEAGNIVGRNRGAGRIFGYTEAGVLGRQTSLLVPVRFPGLAWRRLMEQ